MVDLDQKLDVIDDLMWQVAAPTKVIAERAGIAPETLRRLLRRKRKPLLHIAAKLDYTLRQMLREKQKELNS